MAPGVVIVGNKRLQSAVQRRFVDHNDVIETFSPDRADQTLDVRCLPRGSWSGENFGDLQVRDLLTKGSAIDPITITEQIARRSVPGECLSDLRGGPLGSGMLSHVEMKDAPALVGKNQKDKEKLEVNGRHDEKVRRHQLLDMVLEEYAPGLRRRLAESQHVFGNR